MVNKLDRRDNRRTETYEKAVVLTQATRALIYSRTPVVGTVSVIQDI